MLSSWPVAHANRTKSLNANISLSGSTLDIWSSAASPRMSRWSGYPWEYVVIALATNNIDNGDLATIKTKYATTITAVRSAYPTARVYTSTIPPRTWAGDSTQIAAKDLLRPQVNLWLQSLPLGVHGCFRFDDPTLLGSANRLSTDIDCGDGVHMKTIGYQIMANAIPGRI
jgi:lysophospholipase L1-like esterase